MLTPGDTAYIGIVVDKVLCLVLLLELSKKEKLLLLSTSISFSTNS